MSQPEIDDRVAFLEEYTDERTIPRYTTGTAGKGIDYVLANVYGRLYSKVLDSILAQTSTNRGLRVLEYGCGAGMNLLYICRLLEAKKTAIDEAIGTDFSGALIEAAGKERDALIGPGAREKIRFFEAANETLIADLARGLGQDEQDLCNRFDLVVGVNTFRYAARLHKQQNCANDIARLLAPSGYSIMIDMNDKFPLFKSKFRERNTPKSQTWIPSLEEYAQPFERANLQLLDVSHFCWIPHSAGQLTLLVTRMATPVLNVLTPDFAMRSLVVAKK